MDVKKAFRIFEHIESQEIGTLDKLEAIQEIVRCPTLNSITKDQMKAACGWMLGKILEEKESLERRHNPGCMAEAPGCICNICKNDRDACCKEKIYEGRNGIQFGCAGEKGLSVRKGIDHGNRIVEWGGCWCPDFEREDSACLLGAIIPVEEQEEDSNGKSQSAGAFGILPGK